MTVDEAVRQATDNMKAWHPRVMVSEGGRYGLVHWRRPLRRRGRWCVQFIGFPALVNPHYEGPLLIFDVDYSK